MNDKEQVNDNPIGALVREMERDYVYGKTTISKYVTISMHENINVIDAYLNSKHISGEEDSLGREKPFFNIVNAASNIWYRATDIDRKNIRIRATKVKDTINAFLATILLQDWMRKENFGAFLNDWGRVLARYGSAVVKFVEKDGELFPSVIPWNRLIVDPVDFDSNPKIEVLELTEAQLYQRKGYDKKMIEALCDARKARQTLEGKDKDNKSDYIKVYEVHGELPLSYLTGNSDDSDEYVQQMQVISFVASKAEGKYDDFVLAKGREPKDPFMISHLIKEDGQTLSIGAVQHLFQSQWMMNHSVKAMKDQLDLASKIIFQTADPSFVGKNALSAIENGQILIHKENMPVTQLNNQSHDISSVQNFANMWKAGSNEITGISESMLGNTAPSGTAWRQVETLLQQNQSLFELMTENKGLYLEEMMKVYVLPFIKKKLKHSKEVSAILEANEVNQIDGMYIKNESIRRVNKKVKKSMLSGQPVSPDEMAAMLNGEETQLKNNLSTLGNQRFFKPSEISEKTWEAQFKDMESELEIDVTGEGTNTKEDMATLTTILEVIADPVKRQVLQTPEGKFIFNQIMSKAGTVSPLQLSTLNSASAVAPAVPPVVPPQPVT